MSANPAFHFVLVNSGFARVLHEDAFLEVSRLENDGWSVAWDSARTLEDGYAYAARFHRCVQQDYTDGYGPVPIGDAIPLFRSVSLPELIDIADRGCVSGRGNAFNEFDGRRFVFFGDRITPSLIYQGEDLQRQALTALSGEAVFLDFKRVMDERKETARMFAEAYDRLSANGGRILLHSADLADIVRRMRGGSERVMAMVAGRFSPHSRELCSMHARVASLDREAEELRRHYAEMESDWIGREKEAREGRPFTSAIIETAPLAHGYRYSKETGGVSGMGDEAEYGFCRDSVTASDIVRIHCVRARQTVRLADGRALQDLAFELRQAMELNRGAAFAI